MTFPCYPKYKASGFLWLGDVPEHWTLKRLGHYFEERRERASDTEFEPLSVTKSGIVPRLESAAKTQDGDNRKKVLAGDFVINSRSDRKGSSGLSPLDGSVSLICTVLIPAGLHGPYIHHLFRSELFQEEYYRWGKGIVADLWSTNFSDMKNIVLGVPSEEEQTQIARFLDHETARIDALIEEQQRLIELLKEKRQAVISHAVTKGLAPTVPMKDSGVKWLGEVPCSWRVINFGITHDKAELGGNYEAGESEEGLPLIKMGNIARGKIKLDKVEYVSLNQDIDNGHTLKEGDFLFNTRNSLELVGKVCVWRSELKTALYNSNILRISFNKSLVGSSGFVNYLLNSNLGLEQLRLIARGTTSVAAIYYKDLSSLSFAFPPPGEQRQIERFLDIQTCQLDALVNTAEQAIEIIKERRSALISAAVTGKIDVRDWQPPVSTQAPESAVAEAV